MAFFGPMKPQKWIQPNELDLKLMTQLKSIQSKIIMTEATHGDDQKVYQDNLKSLMVELLKAEKELLKLSFYKFPVKSGMSKSYLQHTLFYFECKILYLEAHLALTTALAKSNAPDIKADDATVVNEQIASYKNHISATQTANQELLTSHPDDNINLPNPSST